MILEMNPIHCAQKKGTQEFRSSCVRKETDK